MSNLRKVRIILDALDSGQEVKTSLGHTLVLVNGEIGFRLESSDNPGEGHVYKYTIPVDKFIKKCNKIPDEDLSGLSTMVK